MITRILRYPDLKSAGIVGNRATLYRWIRDLGFPQGFLIGPNSRGWPEDEVLDWLEKRHARARDLVSSQPTPSPPQR